MSTHCSCHCLVITSLVSCQSESRIHAKKRSTIAKESSEGEFLKKKCCPNRKRIENVSRANAVKEKVTHSDQLEFLILIIIVFI